jgi:hypothetical protein
MSVDDLAVGELERHGRSLISTQQFYQFHGHLALDLTSTWTLPPRAFCKFACG